MTQNDWKDKVIVHLAQSKHCLKNHDDTDLYMRLKEGKTTDEDKECIRWALETLRKAGL